jgi:hypothetical protein
MGLSSFDSIRHNYYRRMPTAFCPAWETFSTARLLLRMVDCRQYRARCLSLYLSKRRENVLGWNLKW